MRDELRTLRDAAAERVTGIGGFFFRTRSLAALARWDQDQLGGTPTPTDYDEKPWRQDAGPTAFTPFPADTDYFRNAEQAWMVCFRVRDLDAMIA